MRIQKEIENVERVKDKIATMPLTMEDAIEFHKQVVDRIEKERKEINKELGLDSDIEEKGFTGASKEPKKVSTPELKKMKLSESLFESLNEDLQDDLINDVYNKLGDLAFEYYEEKNENPTKEEWQKALDWFMEKFFDESNYLDYELEDDEFDESLKEAWGDQYKEQDDITKQVQEIVENTCRRFYVPQNSIEVYKDTSKDALKKYVIDFAYCKGVYPEYWTNLQTTRDKKERVKAFYNAIMSKLKEAAKLNGLAIKNIGYDNHGKIKAITFNANEDDEDESLNESFIKNEKQLAKYIADNFEEITGLNVKDIYNTESDEEIFNQDYVDITYPKIKQFIYDFNEDNDTNFDEEDILYLLDDELSSYKYFNESLNECDKFKKGDCKNYALDEAKISRQNQRRKKDAYLQRKEAEREKAEKEARERERIGDAAWGEKDWIAEREKGDLDFSNYSDEERAEIEKRLKAFDNNETAKAQYQRRKEAEEAKRAEEERKKAEQEKEERTKKRIERIGKLANAPKDIGNAFKKGLGIG